MVLKDKNSGGFKDFENMGIKLQCAELQGLKHKARKGATETGAKLSSRLQNIGGPKCNARKVRKIFCYRTANLKELARRVK